MGLNLSRFIDEDIDLFGVNRNLLAQPAWVYEQLQQHEALQDLGETPKVLFLGGECGRLALKLVEEMGANLGFIEPSFNQNVAVKKVVYDQKLTLSVIDSHQGEFLAYDYLSSYNLVLSIHSWYSHGHSESNLDKALGALDPGGRLFILLNSRQSILPSLAGLGDRVDGLDLTAESLSKWAIEKGKLHKFGHIPFRRPFAEFVVGSEFTDLGKKVVRYWVGQAKWEEIGDENVSRMLDLFRMNQEEQFLPLPMGYLSFEASA